MLLYYFMSVKTLIRKSLLTSPPEADQRPEGLSIVELRSQERAKVKHMKEAN